MAKRPAWSISGDSVICKEFEFEWNGGFALKQKQKNVENLHFSIKNGTGGKSLEVSSKGIVPLGKNIGAFSLKYNGIPLENVFQSSKKFEQGGPYRDLLKVTPKEAKQDERIRNSGGIVAFVIDDEEWSIEPQTLFYDYIYVQALIQNYGTNLNLKDYDWFTDIEFNPKKSINCQARSVAIYKLIQSSNIWKCLNNMGTWKEFHIQHVGG
jgi:hypothetical protein